MRLSGGFGHPVKVGAGFLVIAGCKNKEVGPRLLHLLAVSGTYWSAVGAVCHFGRRPLAQLPQTFMLFAPQTLSGPLFLLFLLFLAKLPEILEQYLTLVLVLKLRSNMKFSFGFYSLKQLLTSGHFFQLLTYRESHAFSCSRLDSRHSLHSGIMLPTHQKT